MVVRERNGLSYNIEASYTPLWRYRNRRHLLQFEHGNAEQCIELIEGQLQRLRTQPLTSRQLSMAKKQFIAQLAISSESNRKLHAQCREKPADPRQKSTPWSRSTPKSAN